MLVLNVSSKLCFIMFCVSPTAKVKSHWLKQSNWELIIVCYSALKHVIHKKI